MAALPWITRGTTRSLLALLAVLITSYDLLFFSYVDLLPSGLWRFHNIHYFKWTLPGLLLLAVALCRALVQGKRRPAVIALMMVVLLTCFRLISDRVGEGAPAWMVQLPTTPPDMKDSYFARFLLHDYAGPLRPVIDYRALPDTQGWRLIALRRPFIGRLIGRDTAPWSVALHGPTIRWNMAVRYGLPCWIANCGRLAPAP